ncbi:hypothetical protein SBA3_880017 [Candidatus Sulfopaludibacter sp. SbA3]|nr:hypothetical protein SBA3_880017 [Candidatus Sulfopaludibacter sp. SbA3]
MPGARCHGRYPQPRPGHESSGSAGPQAGPDHGTARLRRPDHRRVRRGAGIVARHRQTRLERGPPVAAKGAVLTADRWDRVKQIVADALELGREARPVFVQEKCAGDESLRGEVGGGAARADAAIRQSRAGAGRTAHDRQRRVCARHPAVRTAGRPAALPDRNRLAGGMGSRGMPAARPEAQFVGPRSGGPRHPWRSR